MDFKEEKKTQDSPLDGAAATEESADNDIKESDNNERTTSDRHYQDHMERTRALEASFGWDTNPNVPLQLAILGPEDDLSTLAGDTVSGSVIPESAAVNYAYTTSDRNQEYSRDLRSPRRREFKEYDLKTPTQPKKKRWDPYSRSDDDDEEDNKTQPETPASTPGKASVDNDIENGDDESVYKNSRGSRNFFLCAAVLGAFLVVVICGLLFAYIQITNGTEKDSNALLDDFNDGFDFDDVPSPSRAPAVVPTGAPVKVEQPTFVAPTTTGEQTNDPTSAPLVITAAPIPVSLEAQADLVLVLQAQGVDTDDFIFQLDSPQYRGLQWLAADPNYFAYTDSRLIQRWSLAVFILGLTTTAIEATATEYTDDDIVDGTSRIRNPAAAILSGWLEYETNECDWFSSLETSFVCNGFGYYERLDLENLQLYGTIPGELSLLASSLRQLDLRGNYLSGTIPSELGKLTGVVELLLTENDLVGEIPSEIGMLSNLQELELGKNELSGPIPSELAGLAALRSMKLSNNQLTGTLPWQFGNLTNLEWINVENNALTGTIPTLWGGLTMLESCFVGENYLSGAVPEEMCALEHLNSLEADCHLVACHCCSACTPTPEPSQSPTGTPTIPPTIAPTFTPSETPSMVPSITVTPPPSLDPTSIPTALPTLEPTESPTVTSSESPTACTHVEWIPDCISSGESLEIRFQNCDVATNDWIGIYSVNDDPANLGRPLLWAWTCGSQFCGTSPTAGTVILDEDDVYGGTWPLEEAEYVAYLLRNTNPYQVVARSDVVTISSSNC